MELKTRTIWARIFDRETILKRLDEIAGLKSKALEMEQLFTQAAELASQCDPRFKEVLNKAKRLADEILDKLEAVKPEVLAKEGLGGIGDINVLKSIIAEYRSAATMDVLLESRMCKKG